MGWSGWLELAIPIPISWYEWSCGKFNLHYFVLRHATIECNTITMQSDLIAGLLVARYSDYSTMKPLNSRATIPQNKTRFATGEKLFNFVYIVSTTSCRAVPQPLSLPARPKPSGWWSAGPFTVQCNWQRIYSFIRNMPLPPRRPFRFSKETMWQKQKPNLHQSCIPPPYLEWLSVLMSVAADVAVPFLSMHRARKNVFDIHIVSHNAGSRLCFLAGRHQIPARIMFQVNNVLLITITPFIAAQCTFYSALFCGHIWH